LSYTRSLPLRCPRTRGASTRRRPLDQRQAPALPCDSHDAPERHGRCFDRSPLVARLHLRGAMARLIA